MLVKIQSAISLFTCGCLISAAASPSSIGIVVTNGQASVDGTVVHGNSTLFQGSIVQAGEMTSDLMFSGGSNLVLQPGSAVKVYREHAVLQRGVVIQHGAHGYTTIADGLKVSSLSPQGTVVVDVQDGFHLQVAARGGAAEVRTSAGNLVARLEPGKALSFALQSSGQNSSSTSGQTVSQVTIHGILRKDHPGRYGHYLLTDVITNITYELQGTGLDDLVGAAVEANGTVFEATPAAGASKVVAVADIHQMPLSEVPGYSAPGNGAKAAAPTAPAAAPSTGTTTPAPSTGAAAAPTGGANPTGTANPADNTGAAPDNGAAAEPPTPAEHTGNGNGVKIAAIAGIGAAAAIGAALALGHKSSTTVSPE